MILRLVLSFYFLCFVTGNSWTRKYTDSPQKPASGEQTLPCKDGEDVPETISNPQGQQALRTDDGAETEDNLPFTRTTSVETPLEKELFSTDDEKLARQNHFKREMDILTSESQTNLIRIPDELVKENAVRSRAPDLQTQDCYSGITVKRIMLGVLENVKQNPYDIDMLLNELRKEIEAESRYFEYKNDLKADMIKTMFMQYQYGDGGKFESYPQCTGAFAKLADTALKSYLDLEKFPLCLQVMFGYKGETIQPPKPRPQGPDINFIIATILQKVRQYVQDLPHPQPTPQKVQINIPDIVEYVEPSPTPVYVEPVPVQPMPEIVIPQEPTPDIPYAYPEYPVYPQIPEMVDLPEPEPETESPYLPPQISPQEADGLPEYIPETEPEPEPIPQPEFAPAQPPLPIYIDQPTQKPIPQIWFPPEVVKPEPEVYPMPQIYEPEPEVYPMPDIYEPEPEVYPMPEYIEPEPEIYPMPDIYKPQPEYPMPEFIDTQPEGHPEIYDKPPDTIYYEQSEPVYIEPKPIYVQPTPFIVEPKPIYVEPTPVYVEPKPVYIEPEPVYIEPKPVYVEPEPIYVEPTPIYVEPKPIYEPQPIYEPLPTYEPQPTYEPEPSYIDQRPGQVEPTPDYIEPRPTYVEPEPTYIDAYIEPRPVYIEPRPEYIEPRPEYIEPRPDYIEPRPDYIEPRPEYIEPRPEYIEPRPDYIEPRPEYIEPRPEYIEPRPEYIEPRPDYIEPRPDYIEPRPDYIEPRPTYIEPRPTYIEPRPTYIEPRPTYIEPLPTYIEPSPSYIEPQPIYVEPEPIYIEPSPIYVEPTSIYVEPTPEVYPMHEIIVRPTKIFPSPMPTQSNVVNLILQLVTENPQPNIETIYTILKQNRMAFKPKLYKILFALLNSFRKGTVDSYHIHELFYFLLQPQKNKVWNDEKRQVLSYLLLPDKTGQVDNTSLDVILALIHAQDTYTVSILDQILPLLKPIKDGRADRRTVAIILDLLNQKKKRILRPDQIDILLTLIKPNKKGRILPKYIDIASPLVHWNEISYLNPEYVNIIFSLLRPNIEGQIDLKAIEIIHEILSPKKINFLTKKQIQIIFSFLKTNPIGIIEPKRLDVVLFIIKNMSRAPRPINVLIKLLRDVDIIHSKYIDILLSLQRRGMLSFQLLEALISLLKQEQSGNVDQHIVNNILLLLEPYKTTNPKIVIDIFNLLRPIEYSSTATNINFNMNTVPESLKILLYYLSNLGINQIGDIQLPGIEPIQTHYIVEGYGSSDHQPALKLNLITKILQMLHWDQKREFATKPLAQDYGFIELTYMLKHQKPLLYHPVYYVKYRIPMVSFLTNVKTLITEHPQLTTDPAKLLQELIIEGNVSEVSPNLKGYRKEDILKLTFKDGDLVQAKVLDENSLNLNQQIKILHDLNLDISPEDILQQNEMNAAQFYTNMGAELGGLTGLIGQANIGALANIGSLADIGGLANAGGYIAGIPKGKYSNKGSTAMPNVDYANMGSLANLGGLAHFDGLSNIASLANIGGGFANMGGANVGGFGFAHVGTSGNGGYANMAGSASMGGYANTGSNMGGYANIGGSSSIGGNLGNLGGSNLGDFSQQFGYSPMYYKKRRDSGSPFLRSDDQETNDTRQHGNDTSHEPN